MFRWLKSAFTSLKKKLRQAGERLGLLKTWEEKKQELNKALIYEASCGRSIKRVEKLLEKGADIHAENDEALQQAANSNKLDMVRLLLKKGANVHADNDNALRWAAFDGHLDMVRLLLEKGANIHAKNDAALCRAARNGHLEVIRLLLEKGANIHAHNDLALRWATERNHPATVGYLLAQYKEPFDFSLIANKFNPATFVLSDLKKVAGVSNEEARKLQEALVTSLRDKTPLPEPLAPLQQKITKDLAQEWMTMTETLSRSPAVKAVTHLIEPHKQPRKQPQSFLELMPKDLSNELLHYIAGKPVPSFMAAPLKTHVKAGHSSAIIQNALRHSIYSEDPKAKVDYFHTPVGPYTHRYVCEAIQQQARENGVRAF